MGPADAPPIRDRRPPNRLRVLAALARGALGPAYDPAVPERMADLIAQLAAGSDRNRLLSTLGRIDTRAGALALTGRAVPASWLSPAEAERLLQRWQHSRVAALRGLQKTITSLAAAALYSHAGPARDRVGYPGPLGPPPAEAKRLSPLQVESNEETSCDVVVVGSGAGGGCAAAVLAAAGLDVVVLEKGSYLSESDFTHEESAATRDLYLYGMTLATDDLGCQIIAGSTLGGGTVVNYTTSFKTPPKVLQEWADVSGIDAFVSGEIEESLEVAARRVNVNSDSSAAGRRDELMEEGLKSLGWHVDGMPRAVKGCTQDESCGYCGFGCRVGAKQSTMRTFLEDAAAAGARMYVGLDVRRVLIRDGRADGVVAEGRNGSLVVRARAVVAAAGAIETPALLLRSGLRGQVGRNLRLHPGTAALGMFDDDVRVWEGTTQARVSRQLAGVDDGYGPLLETVPIHPGAGAAAFPWTSARAHLEYMDRFAKMSFVAVLPRDRTSGTVRVGRDGAPRVRYRMDEGDRRRVAEGVIEAARVAEAAGAREIFTLHIPPLSYRPGAPNAHARWAEEVRRAGYGNSRTTHFSYHQMGSCRMGIDPTRSAVGPDNESHEVSGLYVMDASTFPTASGVNPMLSIYGIAHRAATKLAARLA